MKRHIGGLYDKWHPRIEGQIRHTMGQHPKWFVFKNAADKETCVNSLAKRIVGEIIADSKIGNNSVDNVE